MEGNFTDQPQYVAQHGWLSFSINEHFFFFFLFSFLRLAESVLEKIPSSVAALLCTAVACICQSLSQSSKVSSTAQNINTWLPTS